MTSFLLVCQIFFDWNSTVQTKNICCMRTEQMTMRLPSRPLRINPSSSEISNASKSACSVSLLSVSICSALHCVLLQCALALRELLWASVVKLALSLLSLTLSPFFSTKSQSHFLSCNVSSKSEAEISYLVLYAIYRVSCLLAHILRNKPINHCVHVTQPLQ